LKFRKRIALAALLPMFAFTSSNAAQPGFIGLEIALPPARQGPQLPLDASILQVADTLSIKGMAVGPALTRAAVPYVARSASENDLRCLTEAIYYEARSEGQQGQRAVAQVVLNRVRHPSYPASICGVVYQGSGRSTGCQFSFTCDGSRFHRIERFAFAEATRIAEDALNGYVYAPIGYATHYHTVDVRPYWSSSLTMIGLVGEHIFYRWRGRAGEPRAFVRG
jgi:spore germination cell wall hydrolase CwlJ-like protein